MNHNQTPLIGVGLPAAVPGGDARAVAAWASESERLGLDAVATLDRLIYDNLDPIVALAAAAARTERVELMATVLAVPFRANAVALAKQLASLDRISQGRLTLGLALGGWPQDYALSGEPLQGRGGRLDRMLADMRCAWAGDLEGASGPLPALPDGRPTVLFGGMAPATFRRVAAHGEGWVAPFFGYDVLRSGIDSASREWERAGRPGRPRIVAERYFSLGPDAGRVADHYLEHYYGHEYAPAARADTVTTPEGLAEELERLTAAGVDDVLLFPCVDDIGELSRLADALVHAGSSPSPQQP